MARFVIIIEDQPDGMLIVGTEPDIRTMFDERVAATPLGTPIKMSAAEAAATAAWFGIERAAKSANWPIQRIAEFDKAKLNS